MDPIDGVLVTWGNNLNTMTVEITAPEDSLYAGDVFEVEFQLDKGYPQSAPRIIMKTPIVHPNITSQGAICVSSIRKGYDQSITLRLILDEIIYALRHPNPDDELNYKVAQLMKTNMAQFEEEVRMRVEKNKMERGD